VLTGACVSSKSEFRNYQRVDALANLQARSPLINGFWRGSLSWWASDILLTFFFVALTATKRYAGEGFADTAGSTKGGLLVPWICIARWLFSVSGSRHGLMGESHGLIRDRP
jgi:hypothetical protein